MYRFKSEVMGTEAAAKMKVAETAIKAAAFPYCTAMHMEIQNQTSLRVRVTRKSKETC